MKELEKFGFVHKTKFKNYGAVIEVEHYRKNIDEYDGINIFTKSCSVSEYFSNEDIKDARTLYIMNNDYSYMESPEYKVPNILFDLIQAGLVEKVVEE